MTNLYEFSLGNECELERRTIGKQVVLCGQSNAPTLPKLPSPRSLVGQVKEMVEDSRKRMMETANTTAKAVISTLPTQMRGSLLDLLTSELASEIEKGRN